MDIHLWSRAAREHLLRVLPGRWRVEPPYLVFEEVGWTARVVAPQPAQHRPGYYLEAFSQLLAVPSRAPVLDNGLRVGHAGMGGYWDAAAGVEAYAPSMRRIGELIRAEVVPHFARYGTVEGHQRHLRERMATLATRGGAWIDVNVDEALAYTHLIRGDLAGAARAADDARRAVEQSGSIPWVREAYRRVSRVMAVAGRDPAAAVELLRGNARRTARALDLPAPLLST